MERGRVEVQKKGSRGGRKIFSNQGKGVSKSIREIVLLKMCFCYVRLTCLNVRVSEREEDIHTHEICLLIHSSLEGLVQAAASSQEFVLVSLRAGRSPST